MKNVIIITDFLVKRFILSTYLYFIRHGESIGNINRICLGHTDLDLTEKGRAQAALAGDALSDVVFSKIYSSDLIRAYNTALPHAEKRGMEIVATKELRELYFGKWENCSVDWLIENFHDDFMIGWRKRFGDFVAPDGESVSAMADRMCSFAAKVAKEGQGTNILLASHAAAIRAMWARLCGIEPSEVGVKLPFPANASYSIVEWDGERLIPVSYSNDLHLGDLTSPVPG